jgi:hypothetical protein
MDAMKYSITKALLVYQPTEIIACLYDTTGELITLMKNFFSAQIEKDRENEKLKENEIVQFTQILILLDDVSTIKTIDWNYDISFWGFMKYLTEKSILSYSIAIDKEGENSNTAKAAERAGLTGVYETNSRDSFGIRMADILAGVISKLLKALHKGLQYASPKEQINRKILDKSWFHLNERQFAIYKKMHHIAIDLNKAWYKAYAGFNADDLIVFIEFLNYIDHFESVEAITRDIDMQPEYFNSCCCASLAEHFKRMKNKLQVDPIEDVGNDYFLNERGAKIYYNIEEQPNLVINNGTRIYDVLSVGLSKKFDPMITIREEHKSICYRIPNELSEWAMTVVGFANSGQNLFPARVAFTKNSDGYFADIL